MVREGIRDGPHLINSKLQESSNFIQGSRILKSRMEELPRLEGWMFRQQLLIQLTDQLCKVIEEDSLLLAKQIVHQQHMH